LLAAGATLAGDALAAEVHTALASVGIRAILLKGSSIISWLYGEGSERYSEDVDLLVSPDRLEEAGGVLRRLGFTAFEPPRADRHAQAWLREPARLSVDLHWTLAGLGVSPREAWKALSQETEWLSVGQGRVETLSPKARALHLALHASQQGIEAEKSLADLARALERLSFELWEGAAALAERLGATPAFAAGLRLDPKGQVVADRLGLPRWKSSELILREQTAPDMTLALNRALETPGVRAKAGYLLRRAFPPPEEMRARDLLAKRGAVGLAAAYARRAWWLLIRLGPAVRVVLAARRQSRMSAGVG